jgi:hypothetical protein
MAKYRWGFETIENGNPIFTECFPIVEDGTSLDYAQQTNEVFYRAKLNGTITFRFDTFDYIIDAGYNAVHIVVLQRYDETESDFVEVWRGKFTLTDCTINYDTHTIDVTPETQDRYTAILEHQEDEYNLVKLAAEQQPVGIKIRPVYQIYSLNDSKLVNLIDGNSWEVSCDVTGTATIENDFHFRMIGENFAVSIKWGNNLPSDIDDTNVAGKTITYSGTPDYSGSPRLFDVVGRYVSGYTPLGEPIYTDHKLECFIYQDSDDTRFSCRYYTYYGYSSQTNIVSATFERDEAGTAAAITTLSYVEDANAQWDKIYCRLLLNYEGDTYHGEPLYDLASTDMAGSNLNYNKISRIAPLSIAFNPNTQPSPSEWGLSYDGRYFVRPAGQNMPIGQGLWKYVSVWGVLLVPYEVFDDAIKKVTIRDSYLLPSVIVRLFQKAGVYPDYFISRVLIGGNGYVGDAFQLAVTPRSNVIASYYDTPAQNAPISLSKVLSMLKQVYQIYWHIDENGNLHFEHISYYDNGYQYSEDEPVVILDLESELHTRTLKSKAFGQNQIKFDKQDMPAVFTFGWADAQTPPFDGWPIKMKDQYVQLGTTDEKAIGDFDSDVDYVLASPSDVSKDGLFLFACPYVGGSVSWNLDLQDFTIKDETGYEYAVRIQNADAAFYKLHDTFWRYHLPAENIEVNNSDTNALTTGSYKLQTLEFADTAMADIIGNVDNCNKIIRTQQGDGHVKTLSINLNSLATKADLLFNFVGRWYYLRGTALGASITISVNGESVTIDVSNNTFKYRYKEPIAALDFSGTDVVSVNFADCDNLNNLTSAGEMFKNCAELLAVDFANKTFGAVTTANDMFAGCSELTTLICPPTASWKADLDFSDCPNLTIESLNDLINDFLYSFDSGTHTITPNSTMWNALDGAVQDDIIARATAKGWTIAIPAQYSVTGTSAGSVVYATINGNAVEIDVVGGNWSYNYNTPISSIAFTNDTNLQTIDFSLSDGLASLTSLDNAFKGCTMLTAVDFTNCDLTNVASASNCFASCGSLFNLTIPNNTWKADVDFSACSLITYAEMQDIIGGLYTYTSGTHTITWNTTYWDSLTQAQQQTISDAADAKGWTTNAVDTIFHITGISTRLNSEERMQFNWIDKYGVVTYGDLVSVATNANGEFSYSYEGKRIYAFSLYATGWTSNIKEINFDEDFAECVDMHNAFRGINTLLSVNLPNATFEKVDRLDYMFSTSQNLATIYMPNATFEIATTCEQMFSNCVAITALSLPKATFKNVTNANNVFGFGNAYDRAALVTVDLPEATFEKATNVWHFSFRCRLMTTLNMPKATFESVNGVNSSDGSVDWMRYCGSLTTLNVPQNSTAIKSTSNPTYNPMNLADAPLTYQSMLKVANWLSDLTGQSAHTCTFKASAWNALTAAEQNTIDTILSGKNWNRAIA